VTLVIGAAGVGDGRVTGLPAVVHLADESLGAVRRVLLTTTDEARPPGFVRVAEGIPHGTLLTPRTGGPLAVLAMHLRAYRYALLDVGLDAVLALGRIRERGARLRAGGWGREEGEGS